ncbi:MAG TPA: MBL fold metallo-hydrolase [Candidatus Krumholzibacteriaceae bacterium]|nr:MBL fold metallo-hydrolase [Candidatus Krumholzibacteriaceae bacterium]
MKLGDFFLKPVTAGTLLLDGGAMFGVVPRALWSRTNPADDNNRIDMNMRILYIEGKGRKIVIDSGAGTKLGEKMVRNYGVRCKDLKDLFKSEGLDPGSVTDVISTHLHFDHAGGLTRYNEDGELVLTFPNARHYIQKKQWEAAFHPNEKDRASFFEENYLPVEKEGKLSLVEGEKEIIPGVKLIPTEGHTPGHQIILVKSPEGNLLYCGDLIPLASHINLPYIMAYDHFPLTTLREKKEILARAADEGWILFFEHDPVIAACKVKRNERGRFEISRQVDME